MFVFCQIYLKNFIKSCGKWEQFLFWWFYGIYYESLRLLICHVLLLRFIFRVIKLFKLKNFLMKPFFWYKFMVITELLKSNSNMNSNMTWSVLLNGWVFVYELSGCGFESHCYHLMMILINATARFSSPAYQKFDCQSRRLVKVRGKL